MDRIQNVLSSICLEKAKHQRGGLTKLSVFISQPTVLKAVIQTDGGKTSQIP